METPVFDATQADCHQSADSGRRENRPGPLPLRRRMDRPPATPQGDGQAVGARHLRDDRRQRRGCGRRAVAKIRDGEDAGDRSLRGHEGRRAVEPGGSGRRGSGRRLVQGHAPGPGRDDGPPAEDALGEGRVRVPARLRAVARPAVWPAGGDHQHRGPLRRSTRSSSPPPRGTSAKRRSSTRRWR